MLQAVSPGMRNEPTSMCLRGDARAHTHAHTHTDTHHTHTHTHTHTHAHTHTQTHTTHTYTHTTHILMFPPPACPQVPSDIEDEVNAERKRSHADATPSHQSNPSVQALLEEARIEAKGSKWAKQVCAWCFRFVSMAAAGLLSEWRTLRPRAGSGPSRHVESIVFQICVNGCWWFPKREARMKHNKNAKFARYMVVSMLFWCICKETHASRSKGSKVGRAGTCVRRKHVG